MNVTILNSVTMASRWMTQVSTKDSTSAQMRGFRAAICTRVRQTKIVNSGRFPWKIDRKIEDKGKECHGPSRKLILRGFERKRGERRRWKGRWNVTLARKSAQVRRKSIEHRKLLLSPRKWKGHKRSFHSIFTPFLFRRVLLSDSCSSDSNGDDGGDEQHVTHVLAFHLLKCHDNSPEVI